MAYSIRGGESLEETLPRCEGVSRRGGSCLYGPLWDVSSTIAKEGTGNTNIQDHGPFDGGFHICVEVGPHVQTYGDFELDTRLWSLSSDPREILCVYSRGSRYTGCLSRGEHRRE